MNIQKRVYLILFLFLQYIKPFKKYEEKNLDVRYIYSKQNVFSFPL